MDLILWRHADAVPAKNDDDAWRELSGRGRKQAAQMAGWLEHRLPEATKIYCGPSRREVQTGEYLARASGRRLHIREDLGTAAGVAATLLAADWPNGRHPVVLIGQQPSLGRLASSLLFGVSADLAIRKAAICWLSNRKRPDDAGPAEAEGVVLRAFVTPDLV